MHLLYVRFLLVFLLACFVAVLMYYVGKQRHKTKTIYSMSERVYARQWLLLARSLPSCCRLYSHTMVLIQLPLCVGGCGGDVYAHTHTQPHPRQAERRVSERTQVSDGCTNRGRATAADERAGWLAD